MIDINKLVIELKEDEGFRGDPYKCSQNKLTVGYGTTFPLSKKEATVILRMRLVDKIEELKHNYIFNSLNPQAQTIIANMTYQMGVSGVLKFKKMWAALESQDYKSAANEMLDSRWARQTPNRAIELSKRMRNIQG